MNYPLLFGIALTAVTALTPAVMAATGLQRGPTPLSDRRFPFVEQGSAFAGTALEMSKARVPAVTIVVGKEDDAAIWAQAASLAMMLGQATQTPAHGVRELATRAFVPIVRSDAELTQADLGRRHLILLGTKNRLIERLSSKVPSRLGQDGPALWVVEDAFATGKSVMVVTGRGASDVSQAVDYLAHERLFFKAGAYDGFFAFVRLRGYLEKESFGPALDLLDDPRQLKGCAKPVTQMAPMAAKMPPGVAELALHRNKLVFQDIRGAVERGDAKQAIATWKEAMQTCYACHQGRGGKQVRMFKPLAYPHAQHQEIAQAAGLSCVSCHQGVTEQVGY